jgi:hypothetical protein
MDAGAGPGRKSAGETASLLRAGTPGWEEKFHRTDAPIPASPRISAGQHFGTRTGKSGKARDGTLRSATVTGDPALRADQGVRGPAHTIVADRYRSIVDVYALLQRPDGMILLLERSGTGYADGQLCPPSGHLEAGESVRSEARFRAAAVRYASARPASPGSRSPRTQALTTTDGEGGNGYAGLRYRGLARRRGC